MSSRFKRNAIAFAIGFASITLVATSVYATGLVDNSTNANASANAGAVGVGVGVGVGQGGAGGLGGAGGAGVGTVGQSVDTHAYGGGSTGLTSTAPCLGSFGILFNAISGTQVMEGCVIRLYAKQCKDDACRQTLTCLDPDLPQAAKSALGCKAPE